MTTTTTSSVPDPIFDMSMDTLQQVEAEAAAKVGVKNEKRSTSNGKTQNSSSKRVSTGKRGAQAVEISPSPPPRRPRQSRSDTPPTRSWKH